MKKVKKGIHPDYHPVVFMDSTSDLAGGGTPSILSIPYNIDTYLDLISEAAKKVK